jgi:hypothetical protein
MCLESGWLHCKLLRRACCCTESFLGILDFPVVFLFVFPLFSYLSRFHIKNFVPPFCSEIHFSSQDQMILLSGTSNRFVIPATPMYSGVYRFVYPLLYSAWSHANSAGLVPFRRLCRSSTRR